MNLGILLQGSYVKNYTKNVILYYIKEFPESYICLSTWEDDYEQFEDEIDSLKSNKNIIIKINKKPKISGRANVNYQIVSSINGLLELNKIDKNLIVVKCRTDFIWFDLKKIISKYHKYLNDKILALYPTNLINSPFVVSDYLFIGKINLLIELFDISLLNEGNERLINKRINKKYERVILLLNNFSWGNNKVFYSMPELAVEAYIIINYFKKLGYIIPKNIFLKHFFSVHLIVKHFELINIDEINYSSLKNHAIKYDGTSFQFYKNLVEKEKHLKLSWLIIKKLVKDIIYKYKSYIYFFYYLLKRKY